MKRIKWMWLLLLLGFFPILLASCAGDQAINSVVVGPAGISIPAGQKQQFSATGFFNDDTSGDITRQVTWTSSNPSVATIDANGLATTFTPGTTVITATSSMKTSAPNVGSASVTLTVSSAVLTSINLQPANAVLPPGVTQAFKANGIFSDGVTIDITSQVAWSSSNVSIATIDATGMATTVATGTATITAVSGTISGSTTLNVNASTLSSITLGPLIPPTIQTTPAGLTQQFTATGTYSDNTSYDLTRLVTWTSSNAGVATIDSNGLATAATAGPATITATYRGVSKSTTLTVNPGILQSISVTFPDQDKPLPLGGTRQFTATASYDSGPSQNITAFVTWSSSNESVAKVTTGVNGGLVTGFAAGSATITATFGAISGSAPVTISGG